MPIQFFFKSALSTIHTSSEEYKIKLACFDYDQTLVIPKDNRPFPKDVDDWQFILETIPEVLRIYSKTHLIVIFTNQSKEWKCNQLFHVFKTLDIPCVISIAFEKSEYKPNPISFDTLFPNKLVIDFDNSFFVGDALGRRSDFSDSDKIFAQNVGLKIYSPESFFYTSDDVNVNVFNLPILETNPKGEIIILVGYPGSGKTTIAKEIFGKVDYVLIHGDEYKTSSKMIKKAKEYVSMQKSIVFDATNSTIKKRNEYVNFALINNYKVRCIYVSTSLEESMRRNQLRPSEQQVSRIVYNVYKKNFEKPGELEGFILETV